MHFHFKTPLTSERAFVVRGTFQNALICFTVENYRTLHSTKIDIAINYCEVGYFCFEICDLLTLGAHKSA